MEHKRETDIEDYWLIQYQRLLESKPLTLLEKVCVISYVTRVSALSGRHILCRVLAI